MKYLNLCLIWTAYCVLHSFLISITFTKFITHLLRRYYAFYRVFYVVLSLILLIWVIRYEDQFEGENIITYSSTLSAISYVLTIISLIMFFWAFFFSYDSLSFFGIRQILNFVKPKDADNSLGIKRNGLLGVVRHPMYLALIIFLWSQTFTIADIYVNIVLTAYVIIGTVLEEKKLILEFGSEYEIYQKEVPMLIPFTKRKQLMLR